MKNVYHDYELENDTAEAAREEFPEPEVPYNAPKKRRRVEYDEHGRKRKDKSTNWVKILIIILLVIAVNAYFMHTCGEQMAQLLA